MAIKGCDPTSIDTIISWLNGTGATVWDAIYATLNMVECVVTQLYSGPAKMAAPAAGAGLGCPTPKMTTAEYPALVADLEALKAGTDPKAIDWKGLLGKLLALLALLLGS